MDAVGVSVYEARFHDEATRSHEWLERQQAKVEAGSRSWKRCSETANGAWVAQRASRHRGDVRRVNRVAPVRCGGQEHRRMHVCSA